MASECCNGQDDDAGEQREEAESWFFCDIATATKAINKFCSSINATFF